MKIVVFGPAMRTGALLGHSIVDLSHACAKYLDEKDDEPNPLQLAEALVPSNLGGLIEGGTRALEYAETALEHLRNQVQSKLGVNGETIEYPAKDVRVRAAG